MIGLMHYFRKGRANSRGMKDYERWFEEKGITDPHDKQIVLDYMRELFEIAIDVVMKEKNEPDLK